MSRVLSKFRGGVHPPEHKAESNTQPVRAAPLPTKLVIPLRQHIGNPAKPVVEVGDHVLKGQMIGAADGYHRWSRTFVEPAVGVPAISGAVAHEVARALRPQTRPEPRAAVSTGVEARSLYWKGRHLR